jgi:hypothetical protein
MSWLLLILIVLMHGSTMKFLAQISTKLTNVVQHCVCISGTEFHQNRLTNVDRNDRNTLQFLYKVCLPLLHFLDSASCFMNLCGHVPYRIYVDMFHIEFLWKSFL